MTVPIKSRVIHQNGESAADKEHQKKEVHKMGQPQPPGETVRNWRTLQIDWRQESLRWKPGNQILSPRNRDWSESDNGKRKNEPGIYPDTKTAIQRIVDSLMDFVECRHKEMVPTVNQVPLLGIVPNPTVDYSGIPRAENEVRQKFSFRRLQFAITAD
jgi:hypothetical protein